MNPVTEQASLQQLRDLLKTVPTGSLPPDQYDETEWLLGCCWDHLVGGNDGGMKIEKLSGRIEGMKWSPPHLTFEIERHGGVVLGSKRAEMQVWTVDVERETATLEKGRFRQMRPNAARLDVRPIAEEIARLIRDGVQDSRLRWNGPDVVNVEIGQIIPDAFPQATVGGRRKRLHKALVSVLGSNGWGPKASSTRWTFKRQNSE